MPNSNRQAYGYLHGAILLFALCALFGKWITLPAVYIVIGRSVFAALAIAVFCVFISQPLRLANNKLLLALIASGILLALHWWSFFYAIAISSVTIGLITFACFPVFASMLEPLFLNTSINKRLIIPALLCCLGIYIIVQDTISDAPVTAIIYGLLSALSFACLTLFNRKFVANTPALQISFYQNLIAGLFLLPTLYYYQRMPTLDELGLLLLLGIVFTALAHTLLINALANLSALVASIAITLEPVYGIIAAVVIFAEPLTLNIVVGIILVISVNIVLPIITKN